VSKYRTAGEIASQALRAVSQHVRIGASIAGLCLMGDAFIADATSRVFTRQKCERGIAMPTAVNINGHTSHYAPEEADAIIKEGDLIKIELGVHIDGYIAIAAHTVVATTNGSEPVQGPNADCVCAAYYASEVALRMLRPGARVSLLFYKILLMRAV
jgi:methionine aminopeptidase